MSIEELVRMSVGELVGAYAKRSLSPVEVLKMTLTHAESVNPTINALFCFHPEDALAVAKASEARWKAREPLGLLDGIPMTVKDSVAIKGWHSTHGIRRIGICRPPPTIPHLPWRFKRAARQSSLKPPCPIVVYLPPASARCTA